MSAEEDCPISPTQSAVGDLLQGSEALYQRLRRAVSIQDRSYHLKKYEKCFVGSEAVDWLVASEVALDRQAAVSLGQQLIDDGFVSHVTKDHGFEDANYFYRFKSDWNHGTKRQTEDGKEYLWDEAVEKKDIPEMDKEAVHIIDPTLSFNAELLDNVHPKWQDPDAKDVYNLVIIGAGAGGLVTAAGASGVGARVALIEENLLGGDCLNTGCVPSKALLRCAKAAHSVRTASEYGINVEGKVSVDFPFIMERLRRLRTKISPNDSADRFASLGVDMFIGKGKFTSSNTVEVNGQTLKFHRAVIAAGARAFVPPIPGLSDVTYVTNETIFNLTTLPKRFAIIGGGPIGCEMAQAFLRFGSEVSVLDQGEKLLPREDPDASEFVQKQLISEGLSLLSSVSITSFSQPDKEGPITISYERDGEKQTLEVDGVLVATGRAANISSLDLEVAKVEVENRHVKINDYCQTTNKHIYAVGDVAHKYKFTHMADAMAKIVIRNSLFLGSSKVSDLFVPWCTYTDPEIAHVGAYSSELEKDGIKFDTYTAEFSHIDRAILDGHTGLIKVYCKAGGDEILGCTIVGNHAGDLITQITTAMYAKTGLGVMGEVIVPYPTEAECFKRVGGQFNKTKLTPFVKKFFRTFLSWRR